MIARFYSIVFTFWLISTLSNPVTAQLHLKLQLIDDLTWGVYVKPIGASPDSTTITGSGQVTVVMPTGYQWNNLESFNGLWSNNASVISPSQAPHAQYIHFGLQVAEPTHPILYQEGVETLLFSFKGVDTCPEFMQLMDCSTPDQSDPFCAILGTCSCTPLNELSVIQFVGGITFYNYTDNYAPLAWVCDDNDGDGFGNGMEDTNGNGIFDPGIDASDLNDPNNAFDEFILLKLQLMPDAQSWGVYAKSIGADIPSQALTAPDARVTVIASTDFEAESLVSHKGTWALNQEIISPIENPDHKYLTFSQTLPQQFGMPEEEEILLFTIKTDGACPSVLSLMDCLSENNNDPFCSIENSLNAEVNTSYSRFIINSFGSPFFHRYGGNYALAAADCNDNDEDGIPNALEDSNGNGIYDSSDTSDLENPCSPSVLADACTYFDGDGDGYYAGISENDPLFDPNDYDSCVPDAYPSHCDLDGDGIPNCDEDTNGNGVYDPDIDASDFTDPNSPPPNGIFMKLQLMPDMSWGVYVKAQGYDGENTTTGSGQVTVVMPAEFEWENLVSYNGLWTNDVGYISPIENPERKYVSFNLASAEPTHPILFAEESETLLFTFESQECPDTLFLIDCSTPNETDPFCPPNTNNSSPSNELSVLSFDDGLKFYNFMDNYGSSSWSCHDNDGDGIPNAHEDTNGNGIYDEGDASDLNTFNQFLPPKLPKLPSYKPLSPSFPIFPDSLQGDQFPEVKLQIGLSNSDPAFALAPNPVRETLFINFEQVQIEQETNLNLFDLQGNILMQEKMIIDGQIKLDVSALPAGMYFLSIDVANGISETKKFVKF